MFILPTVTHRTDGDWRRAGFELEFGGLTLQKAAAVARDALGVSTREEDAAQVVLGNERHGDFTIEIDWEFLKRQAAGQEPDGGEGWVELLSQAAELVVPVEIVCPPLPLEVLDEVLPPLVTALRDAGATGTRDMLIAAYGVHINTEAPDLEADTLWHYLRSFGLLQWWLVDTHDIDFARRISPYIDLYPEAYVRGLCDGPPTARGDLIAHYLRHNPTRNRALDMLPLFSSVDEDAVQAVVDDGRVKARPAFHYRLPNCLIDEPDWSLGEAWESWRIIDDLAQRHDDLDELAQAFLDRRRPLLGVDRAGWTTHVEQWLQRRALA